MGPNITSSQPPSEIDIREHMNQMILNDDQLKSSMKKLNEKIEMGLNPDTKSSSSVKCFITYVQELPTGEEKGKFLALDLGGTNFRVLLIQLDKNHFEMKSKIYVVPKDVMVGTGAKLFDHIADCLAQFTKEHRVHNDNLPLGFTFSFGLLQVGLNKGLIQRWTKGFDCPDALNQDAVQLLKDAVDRRNDVKVRICAILNDTTGTLMSCAWKNRNCRVGVILGTGTNACYCEKIENIKGFDGDKNKPIVLINTEWGAFGDHGELDQIRTDYDYEIDKHSINPGQQIHEKMISGMYLGELVRLVVVKFIKEKVLLRGKLTQQMNERGSFETAFLSDIEGEKKGVYRKCRQILINLGYDEPNITDQDCNNIRYICECISRRAAHLASAGLAVLVNRMEYPSISIGVDGSLYRFHPHMHNLITEKMASLVKPDLKFVLTLSEDGSGRGAALVAASACQ